MAAHSGSAREGIALVRGHRRFHRTPKELTQLPPVEPITDTSAADAVYGRARPRKHALRTTWWSRMRWRLAHPRLLTGALIIGSLVVPAAFTAVYTLEVEPTMRHGSVFAERAELAEALDEAWAADPDDEAREILREASLTGLRSDDAGEVMRATAQVRATFAEDEAS